MVDSSALNGRALNRNSRTLVGGVSRAGARAMFKATGLNDEDLEKPLIAIANTWTEIGPCNIHLRRLATKVKEGIRAAGGTPLEFNTITINDGITMGTAGMKASLISREMIADSIELVTRANYFDGIVALCSCDKTIPGTIMGLIRLNIPWPGALRWHDSAGRARWRAAGHRQRLRGHRRLQRRQNLFGALAAG